MSPFSLLTSSIIIYSNTYVSSHPIMSITFSIQVHTTPVACISMPSRYPIFWVVYQPQMIRVTPAGRRCSANSYYVGITQNCPRIFCQLNSFTFLFTKCGTILVTYSTMTHSTAWTSVLRLSSPTTQSSQACLWYVRQSSWY